MTITVTWMDGKQENYQCSEYQVRDGVLWLQPHPGGLDAPQPRRLVPLGNVRVVTE